MDQGDVSGAVEGGGESAPVSAEAPASVAAAEKKYKLNVYGSEVELSESDLVREAQKGFAADKALDVLRKIGITRALVAASGDIAAGDPPPGPARRRRRHRHCDGAAPRSARSGSPCAARGAARCIPPACRCRGRGAWPAARPG